MQSISHESVHAQLHSYAKYNQYKNEIQKVKCSVLKAHHRLLAAVGFSTRRRHGKGQTYNAFEPQTSSYTSHTGLDSFDLSHAQQRYVHISWYNSREYNSISFTLTTHCLLKKQTAIYSTASSQDQYSTATMSEKSNMGREPPAWFLLVSK